MEYDFFPTEYFKYTVTNERAHLCSYSGCENRISIPKTLDGYVLTSIGWGAFLRCENLVEVIIPNSVTTIGGSAFYACKNLKKVQIPNSVTSIGETAFGRCFNLTEIKLAENHPTYGFFEGALFDKAKKMLLFYFGKKALSSYIVPDFVTTIAHKAFMDCTTLKEVHISDSVITIENMAFYGCKRLQKVSFGNSVTTIGISAFSECRKLRKMELPTSVVSIGVQEIG